MGRTSLNIALVSEVLCKQILHQTFFALILSAKPIGLLACAKLCRVDICSLVCVNVSLA